MDSSTDKCPRLKLSICITTFNRAKFIGATLDSIFGQVTDDCEVVILDCGSTDDTEVLMLDYAERFPQLHFVKQGENNGIDRDYDRIVELARGEYCWLMTDDDHLRPGAIDAVRNALQRDWSLIIVNAELRDTSMSRVLQRGWLHVKADRVYGPGELDRLFVETDDIHTYIGCVVIKREIWTKRERARFYGSLYVHAGVIFQEQLPGDTLLIANPFVSYRIGNVHTFSPRIPELFLVKWPSLVESLALSASARRRVAGAEPWMHLSRLLLLRGLDMYSLAEYKRWVRPRLNSTYQRLPAVVASALPGPVVNTLFVLYYSFGQRRGRWLPGIMRSRFYFRNWAVFRLASYSERRAPQ